MLFVQIASYKLEIFHPLLEDSCIPCADALNFAKPALEKEIK